MPEFTIRWEYHEQVEAADEDAALRIAQNRLERFIGEPEFGVNRSIYCRIERGAAEQAHDPSR